MKILRNENGQMLVFTALSMTILFGFLAMSFEIGMLFREKRFVQTAADAAAQAAALDYFYNNASLGATAVTHATNEAKTATTANGFTDGQNGTTVTVNCPPTYGPKATGGSCNGFFEVFVTKTSSLPFMSTFGSMSGSSANLSSFPVAARAVAGTPSASNNCIWLMDAHASGELTMQGSASTLNANGCGVYLNSDSTGAVSFKGQPSVTVQSLNLLSSQNLTKGTKNFTGQFNNNVVPESPPISPSWQGAGKGDCTITDPIAPVGGKISITSNYTPVGSGSAATSPLVVCFKEPVTISGGVSGTPIVMGGMMYSGSGDTSTSFGVIYEFQAGLTIGTGAWVNFGSYGSYTAPTGTNTVGTYSNTQGATIDMQGGAFNIQSGQANLSVFAPTAGDYNGIAIMQPSGNTSASSDNTCSGQTNGCLSVQFGSANTNFDGMIFVPGGQVTLHDQGGGTTASGLIAATVNMASSTTTINNYSEANPYTTPLLMVQLTE